MTARHNFPMLLREFREYVIKYATQWHTDGQGHHHPIWSRMADALEDVGLNGMGYGVEDVEPKRHIITITLDTVEAVAELTAAYNRLLIPKLQRAAIERGDAVRLELTSAGVSIRLRNTFTASTVVPWTEVDATDLVKAIDDTVDEAKKSLIGDSFKCRECGCTAEDCSGCIERTGSPCYWVEPDLCSACAPAASRAAEQCPRPDECTYPACNCVGRMCVVIERGDPTPPQCPRLLSGPCDFPKCDCDWHDDGTPITPALPKPVRLA